MSNPILERYIDAMASIFYRKIGRAYHSDMTFAKENFNSFKEMANYFFDEGWRSSPKLLSTVLEEFPRDTIKWYCFSDNKLSDHFNDGKGLHLPIPSTTLPDGDFSLVTKSDLTGISACKAKQKSVELNKEGNIMKNMKASLVETKETVQSVAVGQVALQVIRLGITPLVGRYVGFFGRFMGKHKKTADNPLVIAGAAVLLNQAIQAKLANDKVKYIGQAMQDAAVLGAISYIGASTLEKVEEKVLTSSPKIEKIDSQE